jgi:hypothetical protein
MVAMSTFFIGIIGIIGLEGTLCLAATSRKRLGEHARSDLPGEAQRSLHHPH